MKTVFLSANKFSLLRPFLVTFYSSFSKYRFLQYQVFITAFPPFSVCHVWKGTFSGILIGSGLPLPLFVFCYFYPLQVQVATTVAVWRKKVWPVYYRQKGLEMLAHIKSGQTTRHNVFCVFHLYFLKLDLLNPPWTLGKRVECDR